MSESWKSTCKPLMPDRSQTTMVHQCIPSALPFQVNQYIRSQRICALSSSPGPWAPGALTRTGLMWSVWLWGVRRLASYSRGPLSGYGLRSRQGGTPHKYRLLPRSQGLKALNCPPNRGNSSIPSRCWLSRRPKTSGKYLFGLGIAAPKPLRLTRALTPRRNSKRSIR